jgi:hypothetical protein
MGKRGLLFIAGILTLLYGYCVVIYDKGGFSTPATLFGLPIWLITGVVAGALLVFGARWRPVQDPGQYGDSPGCLFWFFGVAFCTALFMGVYFTEPIACVAQDGDECYQYGTLYEVRRNDGSTYNAYYRNNGVWSTWRAVDLAGDALYYSGSSYSGGGDWLSSMDLGDSEIAALIFIMIVIVILVLASAFIPNVWVLACALCLVGFYLTILRMHNQAKLYGGVKPVPPDEPEKPKHSEEGLITGNAS